MSTDVNQELGNLRHRGGRGVLVAAIGAVAAVTLVGWSAIAIYRHAKAQREPPATSSHPPPLGDWAQKVRMPGVPNEVGPPPPPTGNNSSTSKVAVALILTGTRPGRNAHEGYADIGVAAKSPQTYAQGALLANGARLTEIYMDCVVLEKDGQSVRLAIHDGRTPVEALSGKPDAILSVGGTPPPDAPIPNSRESLTDYVRPSPVYVGDSMIGLQVYAGQNAAIFYQLGLEPGDVITSIDEVPASDPQYAMDAIQSLAQGATVTVTITRKGQSETISLDGSVIDAAERQRAVAATVPLGVPMT